MAEYVNHLAVHVVEKSIDTHAVFRPLNRGTRVNGGNVQNGEGRIQFLNFTFEKRKIRAGLVVHSRLLVFFCWTFDSLKLEPPWVGYVALKKKLRLFDVSLSESGST